ncbi:MAG TPA: DMT family transporter [Gaiellaceae bacterium]|jgi:drug/metabolite transporter (DMT)-like permease|nr:DMT family transporter [Gaiellaceae bacterium]
MNAGAARWTTAAAAAVTVFLWASAFVGIRSADTHFDAGPLALGRLVVGCLALGTLVLLRREPLPKRRDLPLIVVCGLLWFAAYNVMLNAAEHHVDAGTASMLVNVGPIFVALLAGILLGEGFPRTLLAGCGVAFAGAVVIGLATAQSGVSLGRGPLLCVLAAAAYAGGVVAQKIVLRGVSPLQTTFLCCVVGALACLPFGPDLVRETAHVPGRSIAWVAYLGLFPTSIAFTTWAYALARTSAGRLGAATYAVPAISILLGWAILGQAPPALAYAGGAICLAGVAISRLRSLGQLDLLRRGRREDELGLPWPQEDEDEDEGDREHRGAGRERGADPVGEEGAGVEAGRIGRGEDGDEHPQPQGTPELVRDVHEP